MKEIFAVIWQDMGLPLSLPCDSADKAKQKAIAMRDKAKANGATIHNLRAVHLSADSDKLITSWAA